MNHRGATEPFRFLEEMRLEALSLYDKKAASFCSWPWCRRHAIAGCTAIAYGGRVGFCAQHCPGKEFGVEFELRCHLHHKYAAKKAESKAADKSKGSPKGSKKTAEDGSSGGDAVAHTPPHGSGVDVTDLCGTEAIRGSPAIPAGVAVGGISARLEAERIGRMEAELFRLRALKQKFDAQVDERVSEVAEPLKVTIDALTTAKAAALADRDAALAQVAELKGELKAAERLFDKLQARRDGDVRARG